MSGKKSAEKNSGGGGIKSFFSSKATPQSKVNEVSPQSAASEENCIDLSKEEKTEKKQANSKTPEPNLFFMSKSQRQQTLAAQREAKEKEIQRQREAEELLIAQQREARIQEEIIRSRKETNLLLLGKSAGEASGSKSHNPFFLARAPAPVKTSQNGGMTSCSNVLAEVVDLPEVHFPSIQNVGLEGSLGALLQQIQSYNNDFRKRPALNATPDTDTLAVTQVCVPDWAKTAFSDLTAQEYSASFALPRGRGGEHSANRAATGQARMYPLAQASLNLRALWLLWVQRTLTEDKASAIASDVSNSNNNSGVLKVPMKVSPSSLTLPESVKKDSCDALSAVDRSPTAILTRWLSDWAAKRARSTGNSSTNDLALTACNINNKNSRSKASHATPSLTRTSSRSQASSAGSNIGGKGRASRNNSVKKGSEVLKRRRGGVVRDDSDDEKEDDDDVDAIEDSSAEEEEEEEEQVGSDEEEDEWQSSAAEEEEGSESEVEYGRSSRRRHSTTASNSSRQLGSRGGIATDEEQLLNVMVLEGPSGSGKSAAVHETARPLGYKVIEVNASHLRNGASIKKLISEAAQSAHIMDNMSGNVALNNSGNGAAVTEMNLILFDEVDIACDDEDAQLHHTIQNLAHISKCPILLTSEQPLPFFKALHAKYVKFTRPDVSTCCSGEGTVDHEGASDALQCLVQNIRALSGAALVKGHGNSSSSSSQAASYSDVTVLDEGIAKHSNTSKSSSSAALAAMFGSAKKPIKQFDATIGAADSGSALPPLPTSALASFSPADRMRLQVLCGLSDGDLRAALSSVQLFSEHFLGATKPAPTTATAVPSSGRTSPFVPSSAVVDLTSSPAAVKRRVSHAGLVDLTSPPEIEDVSRQESGCSFGRFLSETLQLDFALFDSSLGVFDDLLKSAAPPNDDDHKMTLDAASSTETTVTIATGVSTSNSELYAPVVHDVQPRYGLVAGGFLMTITGAHFLQHSASSLPSSDLDESATQPAEVRVFLNGHVSCPCVLKSDTSIVAYVPPMRREGVYTVHVEVLVALPVPATHKVVVARSSLTGVGAAWIHLRQRYFPLMRSAHNSSQKLLVAPAQNRATVRGDTQSTGDLSPGSASSNDEGRAVNDNTDGGDGNRRVAKRLWSCTQDPSEQADTPSTSKQGGASSSNNNNQRRKRRVISDDSDEASDDDSEAEEKKEKAAREKDSNLEEDEDNMSLAESDEDGAVTDAPNSSSSAVKPAAAASTVDASMLQSLVEKVQSSLLATLNRVKGNGHSEPFLLPVDDRDVPGYSQEIARPMDLSTVTESLKEGLYSAPRSLVVNALTGELVCQNNFPDVVSFVEDVRLIWSNCVQFNEKDSPFTRSAYLVSCLFDSTLRDTLQSAFVSFPGAKVLSEDRNGAYICVRLEFNGENVFLVPRCTSFDRCMKLRKVLAPPRIRSLLAERQMSDNSSSGNGENGMVGNNIQNPVPHTAAVGLVSHNGSLLHPASATQPFLTAEEALAPERANATSADKSAVVAALNEAQAKRQLLLNKTPSKKNLVPGLQSIANVSRSLTEGLEYENDECAPIVVLTLPTGTSSVAVRAASQADLLALSQLIALSEAFSVADRFTSVATSLAEYNCLQHEDEASDCASRCWTPSNTSVSAHEGSRSYAQMYSASRYYSTYGDCLRQGVLHVTTDNVRANVDVLQQSSYSSKELSACRKKSGYAYLGSAYLEHNLRRTEHVRLLSAVANKYTSSTGNRAGSAWVSGLIVQHTLPSLCCVPRALAVDVFPLVGVMCRSEMNNDADEEYQQQRRLTQYSSEMSGLGRRSSRRGSSGEKEPELARKHKCFVEMKTILNNTDEKILRQLAVAYDSYQPPAGIN